MVLKIEDVIDRFVTAYKEAAEQHNGLMIAYDERWPSACYQQQGETQTKCKIQKQCHHFGRQHL